MCITNFGPRPTKLITFDHSAVKNEECIPKSSSVFVSKASAVQPIAATPKSDSRERSKSVTKRLPPGLTTKNHQRRFVQHRYRDHSEDKPLSEEEDLIQKTMHVVENNGAYAVSVDSEALNSVKRDPRGGVPVPFPLKLHELLDTIEADGHADVLSWQPHGRSFRVHKTKEFVETIMPRYFRQSKLTSFQRQLNLYGFARITKGRDKGGYYHELFLRGKLFLANRIQRNKVKGTKIKAVTSPETEPDFYSMPFVVITARSPELVSPSSADEIRHGSPLSSSHPMLLPVVSSDSLPDVIQSIRARPVTTTPEENYDSDEASFEGMPFHLVTEDQLVEPHHLPSKSWVSDESSLANSSGCSLGDMSDVIAREETASFHKNSVAVPASLSFSSKASSLEDDDCSLSSLADPNTSKAMLDDDVACFEGMVFHLVSPDQTPSLEEMPRSTSLTSNMKRSVISISSLSSDSDGSSSSDSEDEALYRRPVADVVSKTCPKPFDEWFYEDEEMRLLLD